MVDDWDQAGFKAVVSPCRPSPRAERSGGAVAGIRKSFTSHTLRHLAAREEQTVGLRQASFTPGPIDFHDIVALVWYLGGISLTVIGAYLDPGIGMTGVNIAKMAAIGATVATLSGPWVALADWNMKPSLLQETGWLDRLAARIKVPSNSGHTYTGGRGTLIDFCVHSTSAEPFLTDLWADDRGPWKDHYGLRLGLRLTAAASLGWSLNLRRPFVHPPPPQKRADPASKASRRKAARAQDQDHQLPRRPSHAAILQANLPKQRMWGKMPPHLSYISEEDFERESSEEDSTDTGDGASTDPESSDDDGSVGALPDPAAPTVWSDHEKDTLWSILARDAEAAPDPAWSMPADFIERSECFKDSPSTARQLGSMFGAWVSTLEQYYITLYRLDSPAHGADAYRGRGVALQYSLQKVTTAKACISYRNRAANWWSTVAGLLTEYGRCLRDRSAPRAVQLAGRLRDLATEIPKSSLVPMTVQRRGRWARTLRIISTIENQCVSDTASAAEANAQRAARAAAKRGVGDYVDWVLEMEKTNVGKLHRLVKDKAPVASELRTGAGPPMANLADMMDAKADAWDAKWAADFDTDEFRQLCGHLRAKAATEPLPLITVEMLDAAIRSTSESKAKAVEQLGKRDIANLPRQARQHLCHLFNAVEATLVWPWQLMLVLMALIGKDSGGDRAIGLLPWLARLWCRIR